MEEREETVDGKPEMTDFTVGLQTLDGVEVMLPLSRFRALVPPLQATLMKLGFGFPRLKASEPIFQTVELPLATFAEQDKRYNPSELKTIRLRFDRTRSRVLIFSEIGFERVLNKTL